MASEKEAKERNMKTYRFIIVILLTFLVKISIGDTLRAKPTTKNAHSEQIVGEIFSQE